MQVIFTQTSGNRHDAFAQILCMCGGAQIRLLPPSAPAATSCGLSTCKAGRDVGTWLVCKAEHPFLEEQCGNESLGHWVVPGANVAHMGETNI